MAEFEKMAANQGNNGMAAGREEINRIATELDRLLVNSDNRTSAERFVAVNQLDRDNEYLRRTIETSHEYEHHLMKQNWETIQEIRRRLQSEGRQQRRNAAGANQRNDTGDFDWEAVVVVLGLIVGGLFAISRLTGK